MVLSLQTRLASLIFKFLTDKFTFLFGETPPSATLSCVFLLLGLYMEIDLTLACITVVD